MTVNIRAGNANHTFSPLNPVLGTSSIVVPTGFDSSTSTLLEFDFGSTVPLTPGALYVIQIVDTGSSPGGVYVWSNGNVYGGGEAIVNGAGFSGLEMVFQEGMNAVAPEPSSVCAARDRYHRIAGIWLAAPDKG